MGEIVSADTVAYETGKPRWNNTAGSNNSPLPNIAGQNEGKNLGCFYTLELPLQGNFVLCLQLLLRNIDRATGVRLVRNRRMLRARQEPLYLRNYFR